MIEVGIVGILACVRGEPDMEISELRAAIGDLTARIEQIRDWL